MDDKMKNINAIKSNSLQDSMKPPSPEVQAKINEFIAMNPRILYPFMAEDEYQAMMEARIDSKKLWSKR